MKRKRGGQKKNQNASKKKKGGYVETVPMYGQRLAPELAESIEEYRKEHNLSKKEFLLLAFSMVLGDV